MNAQREVTLMRCPHPGCERTDLRGLGGVAMHERRAHGENWSTKKRPPSQPAEDSH